MGCCTFSPQPVATAALDPTKHVNYVLGMILGEDDFKQEFAYLSGRDQWIARDLIGYGTVRGLSVQTQWDGANGPRVYVDAGAALTPAGQLVCVPSPQCANINAWLEKHAGDVQQAVTSPPANPLPLYVVLCYRDCPDDNVPIPGEPCRTEDQLVKPSRLRDDFVLELTLKRPLQREEETLRAFCNWLGQIDMSDATVVSVEIDQFLDEIRHAAAPWYSPPASPPTSDISFGTPPAWLLINPADACTYLRAAFRLWVTELRPKWYARWYGCAPDLKEPAPLEECVLLAAIQVDLVSEPGTSVLRAAGGALPAVVEDDRPYIVHLRMLQEWLLCGACKHGAVSSPSTGGAVLNLGNTVRAETVFGLPTSAGSSADYARADHTHGTPALPALGGDASGAITNATVTRVRNVEVITTGAAPGQVLTFNNGVWQAGAPPTTAVLTVAGDVTGALAATTVAGIQTRPVDPAVPADNQVLAFSTGAWRPTTLPAAPAPVGDFVGRAPRPYSILAAGFFKFTLNPGGNGVPTGTIDLQTGVLSTYGGLRPANQGRYTPPQGGFVFDVPFEVREDNTIVKLTPWIAANPQGVRNPFIVYVSEIRANQFSVTVSMSPNTEQLVAGVQIEISKIL